MEFENNQDDFPDIVASAPEPSASAIIDRNTALTPFVRDMLSSNFKSGSAGWRLKADGTVEFNSLSLSGTEVTATAAELNILDGATLSTAELNYVDGVTSSIQTQLDSKVDKTQPINIKSANYTLVLTDARKLIYVSSATGKTVEVPPNSDVAFPIGTVIDVLQASVGQVTLTPGSGVTISGRLGLKTAGQHAHCTIKKVLANTWIAYGDLTT